MIVRRHRCAHCGIFILYEHHHSGGDVQHDRTTDLFCEGCADAQREALKAVPKLFEGRWRPIAEVSALMTFLTLDTVLEWERAMVAEGKPIYQRVWVGLIDTVTGDAQNSRGVFAPKTAPFYGMLLRLTTWKKDPAFTIEVEHEWDLTKGEYTGHSWK